jgi:L-glyceraldehyde 3-phosphate reductase
MKEYIASPSRYDESANIYRRCGNSGILLPKISLGFWQNFGAEASYENCREIARMAFDHGVTHFDLANNYGPPPGSAEQMVGRMLKEDLAPYRDEMFIATKAGYEMWPGPYGNWGSRKSLMASIDQSLSRMGLEYVDLFYIHRYDPATPLDETLQALVDIVHYGKALYIGISRWPLEALKYADKYLRAHNVPPLIFQGRLNLIDRAVQDEGILEYCKEAGIGFISFSPLAQGLLTSRYLDGIPNDSRMSKGGSLKEDMLTPELLEKLKGWNTEALEQGETLASMSLKWILGQDGVTSVIVGARTPEQFAQSLKCLY